MYVYKKIIRIKQNIILRFANEKLWQQIKKCFLKQTTTKTTILNIYMLLQFLKIYSIIINTKCTKKTRLAHAHTR